MHMAKQDDLYKQKFRPDADAALDRQIDDALGGLSMDDLYNQSAPAPRASEPLAAKGMRIGRVIRVDQDNVFVDFGGKSQGIASILQFDEIPTVGQEMEFHVDRFDPREGLLVLTRKGAVATNVTWENLEIGQVVEGTVTGMNKGGLELEIKSMRAFMPAGQVDIYFQKDISTLIGQRMTVEVTQFDRAAKNLIVSRRNVLEREREQQKQKLMEELAEGQIRRGTVRSVMDFGAFVDLGGVDGLLHVSEMTFKRGRQNAAEFVKVGDALDVKVLKIDRDTGKLSLSLKQARGTDPWADAAVKYPVGTTLTGRVTRVESFGAFIEVEEGLEGLLPVSEISWQRIKSPQDVLHEGDTIKLVVISLDAVQKRISFSLKQAGPDPWATINDRYAVDMVVDGTITRIAEFGAFVELESGLEGLVHISELAGQRVTSVASAVKAGQIARVRILDIDKDNRRIGLSIKKVAEIEAAPPSAAATTPAPAKKKKNELRGGLDFNFWNKK
jgi:small subunit ribosomal protein S1